jgi:pimeloyl-ACP methyl ester carboxylesterase
MIKPARLLLLVAATLAIAMPASAQSTAASAAGTWAGHISLPPGPLAISVVLARDEAGVWSGTIDIPAQRAHGLKLTGVVVSDPSVTFEIANVGGQPTFTGTRTGDRISGTFSQNGGTFRFELGRGADAAAVAAPPRTPRPQEPKPPLPYTAEDVTYRNDAAGVRLAGTLTRPSTGGPFPAVVLITGSGAEDRDETVFNHKPFLVLADALTRRGIAVLRSDDRGVGGSDRGPAGATSKDFAGDVAAAVAYLETRPDIDRRHIGLIGHSEGGLIAPMVAASSPDVAFIVLMAGPGVPGDQTMYLQAAALARAQGASEALIAWDRSVRQRIYDEVKSETDGKPNAAARQALLVDVPTLPGVMSEAAARQATATILAGASTPWFRFMLAYDPRPTLERVRCPVLAINGERDTQVIAHENLDAIRSALEAGGNRDVTIKALPGLNHLFQTSTTGRPDEYESIDETIAPAALDLIGDWIVRRVQ